MEKNLGLVAQTQISGDVSRAEEAIRELFRENKGNQTENYDEYVRAEDDAQTQKSAEKELFETEIDIARLTSRVMRKFAQRVESGNYVPTVNDFYACWRIQRTMQGLWTSVKPYDTSKPNFDQKLLDEQMTELKRLLELVRGMVGSTKSESSKI
jgi:hypothetical protein